MTRRQQLEAMHAANDKMVSAGLLLRIVDRDGEPAIFCHACGLINEHVGDCSVLARISRLARGESSC